MGPLAVSAGRSLICAAFFLVLLRGRLFIPRNQLPTMLVAAGCYTAVVTFFVIANKYTTAANAIILQYTAPLWIALHIAVTQRRPTRAEAAALVLGATGILLCTGGLTLGIEGRGWRGFVLGDGLAILSGIALAGMTLALRAQASHPIHRNRGTLVSIFWGNAFATLLGAGALLTQWDQAGVPDAAPWVGWALIGWLGLFQLGGGYWLFQRGLRTAPALTASLICLVEPVLNPIWVAIGAGEIPPARGLLGGCLVLAAVTLMLLGEHSPREEAAHA
jgi:drug/metabolite transporter (DMT)-like permease